MGLCPSCSGGDHFNLTEVVVECEAIGLEGANGGPNAIKNNVVTTKPLSISTLSLSPSFPLSLSLPYLP